MSRTAAASLLVFALLSTRWVAQSHSAPGAQESGTHIGATIVPIDTSVRDDADPAIDEGASAAPNEIAEMQEPEQPAETADSTSAVEVIRERYPSSAVKIEREVTQDAEGNYLNHGSWKQWDERGKLLAQGEYVNGQRQGKWFRWYGNDEAPLFIGPGYKGFQPPFGTETNFEAGKLHGVWKVFDAKNRLICEWEFDQGQRHGRSTWHFPSGHKQMELTYVKGQVDGEVIQWDRENKVAARDTYINGRKLAKAVTWHAPKKKKSEGWYLYARENGGAEYDWWNGSAKMIPADKELSNERHGGWAWWYAGGLKQLEGAYDLDKPQGKFTWWHSNGQKQLEGDFRDGKQNGKFTWWYANGQKQLEQDFVNDVAQGEWKRWSQEGKVIEAGNYADGVRPLEPVPSLGADGPKFQSPTADVRTQPLPKAKSQYHR